MNNNDDDGGHSSDENMKSAVMLPQFNADIIFIAEDVFFIIFSFLADLRDMIRLSETCTLAYNAFHSDYFFNVELYKNRYAPKCVLESEWKRNPFGCMLLAELTEYESETASEIQSIQLRVNEISKMVLARSARITRATIWSIPVFTLLLLLLIWPSMFRLARIILWLLVVAVPILVYLVTTWLKKLNQVLLMVICVVLTFVLKHVFSFRIIQYLTACGATLIIGLLLALGFRWLLYSLVAPVELRDRNEQQDCRRRMNEIERGFKTKQTQIRQVVATLSKRNQPTMATPSTKPCIIL